MSFRDGLEEIAYASLLGNQEDLSFTGISKADISVVTHRYVSYLFSDTFDPLSLQPFESTADNCHQKYSEYFRSLGYVVKSISFTLDDLKLFNGQVLLSFDTSTGTPFVIFNINGLKPRIFDCSTGHLLKSTAFSTLNLQVESLLLIPARLSTKTSLTGIFDFGSRRLSSNFLILGLSLLLAAIFGLAYPIILSVLIQTVIPQGLEWQVLQLSVLFAFFSVAFIVSEFASIFVFIFIDTVIDVRVQVATYQRLFNLPTSFFSRYRSGDLMSRAQAVTQIRALLSGSFIDTVVHSSTIVTSLLVLIVLSWKLTILVLVISIIYFVGSFSFGYLEAKNEVQTLRLQGINIGFLFNITKAFLSINSENRIPPLLRQYRFQLQSQLKTSFNTDLYKAFSDTLDITLKSIGLFGLFLFGHMVLKDSKPSDFLGGFTSGKFVAYVSIYSAYIGSIYKLTRSLSKNGSTSMALWSRARPIFTQAPESSDEAVKILQPIKQISLDEVFFKHTSQTNNLFADLNLTFSARETLGITGDVGSGKSSFIDILLGFNTASNGTVSIDGINIRSLDVNTYRSRVAVLTQNREIIPGFLKDFLLNGGQFKPTDVEKILRTLGAWDDFKRYPLGLNTPLAYNGYNFPSSFREQLLLTRAMIHPFDIFISDDALLSSDPSIIDTIRSLSPDAIIIIVTDRQDLLDRCNRRITLTWTEKGTTQVRDSLK